MRHGGSFYDFGMAFQQVPVALVGRLKAPGVGFHLGDDERVLQYSAVKDVELARSFGGLKQAVVRQHVHDGGFEGFHHQPGGFVLEGTFYANYHAAFVREVFGKVFTIFIIELAQHALAHQYDVVAGFSFLQHDFSFFGFAACEEGFQLGFAFGCHFRALGAGNEVDGLFQ